MGRNSYAFDPKAQVGALMTFREILREGTVDCHARVDRLMGCFDLSNRADYTEFLTIHGRIVPPIERWLEGNGVCAELPDWGERQRTSALYHDIGKLGLTPPRELSCVFENTASSRAGILYVIEGSRLGASLLVRRMTDAGAEFPTSFLTHGSGRSLWPTFVAWLNRQKFDPVDTERGLKAAQDVFALYELVLADKSLKRCHKKVEHHDL
jgi:heme oxygenase